MANDIKVYLNVCEEVPEVKLAGRTYQGGHQGEVKLAYTVKDDIASLDLSDLGHRPNVGGASHIQAFSVRVCTDQVSTIAIYDDPKMNVLGCCRCCSNGCCVYGSYGCSCTG